MANPPNSAMSALDERHRIGNERREQTELVERDRIVEEMSVKYRVKAIPVPKPGNTGTILILCTVLLCGAVYMLYGSNIMEYITTKIKMKNAHIASPYKYDQV